MPQSFENLNNKAKLENIETSLKLENPERVLEEVTKLESDIKDGPERVEDQGESLIESGLRSVDLKNEGLLSTGKSIVSMFKEKAEKLTDQYTKLKSLLLIPLVVGNMGTSNPELSQPEKLPKKEYVYADQETTEEMKLLTENYIQEFRTKNPDSKISDKELQVRFNDLAQSYKDDFKIHVGHAEGLVENVALKLASYKGEEGVPDGVHNHNTLGTIYYENHGNLRGFIQEIPHQINNDVTFGKGVMYLQDLGAAALSGDNIYHKFGTVEFSAHEITEKAVEEYLFLRNQEENGLSNGETFQTFLEKKRNAVKALYEAGTPFIDKFDLFPNIPYAVTKDIPSMRYAVTEGVKMILAKNAENAPVDDKVSYLQDYIHELFQDGGLDLEGAKKALARNLDGWK